MSCNAFSVDRACATETPGLSRAMHAKLKPPPSSSSGEGPKGFQICGADVVAMVMGKSSLTFGNENGGRTPTISYGSLLSAIVRPTTLGSALKRPRHRSSLRRTTWSRPR